MAKEKPIRVKKTVRDYENAGYEGYTESGGNLSEGRRSIQQYHNHLPVGTRNSSARDTADTKVTNNIATSSIGSERRKMI